MPDPIRVLLADDHAVVRQGLRTFLDLQPDIEVVGEAEDGREALERVAELRPDVVLMDVVMPGLDGICATRELRERPGESKVVVLSSFSDEEKVLPALRAGALGYLTKDTRPDDLAEGIRAASRGEPVICGEALRHVLGRLGGAERRPEGTVTVLFTDIEGSTNLVEELGDERARELFRAHDGVVRRTAAQHGGVEVEHEGDAFMLAFTSARRGVQGAVAIQRALEREQLPFRVRIGLNTGDVLADEDRYFGRAVFVASRVAARAAGGEVLVSELTRGLAGDDGVTFRDRGSVRLKGLKGEHRLFEVEWRE
jgi:two-component system, NarL family, response regulator LiaR